MVNCLLFVFLVNFEIL